MRGHLALARIGSPLPMEVLIDGAALHEIAPRTEHRADDDFLVLEGVRKSRDQAILPKLGAKKA